MSDAYSKLLNEGPQPINLRNFTYEMRRDGVTHFRPNSSVNGSSVSGGKSKVVCYIIDEHTPEEVIRCWLNENQDVVENVSNWALHARISDYGDEWREASKKLLNPTPHNNTENHGGKTKVSDCPFCGMEIQNDLPNHLTECESHA
jgi:hypothetical protein